MSVTATISFLRRRWIAIVACAVAGLLGATLLSASTGKTYRARTRLLVNIPASRTGSETLQGVQLSSNLLESYAAIAQSRTVAERTSAELGGRLTPGAVQSRIAAAPKPNTLLLDISADDHKPGVARDVANAAAKSTIAVIGELEAGTQGAAQARVLDAAAVPGAPVSPNPKRDGGLGLFFGLTAGLALALVLDATDHSISNAEQARTALGAPVLAHVPRHAGGAVGLISNTLEPGHEAYRSLRTSLRFLGGPDPVRSVLVTSPEGGEGRTTTAANLAVAFAAAGERVIVIDADLRNPRIHQLFRAPAGPGVTSVVFGTTTVDDALVMWQPDVAVLPPGPLPSNPSEVLGSQAMADLLEECTRRADIVIVDAPPVLPVTDAVVLSALVDGVVVVTQWRATTTEVAEEVRSTFSAVSAPVLGVVINGVRGRGARDEQPRAYGKSDAPTLVPFSRQRSD